MTLDDGRQTIMARLAAAAAPAALPGPLPEITPEAGRDTDALVERFVQALDRIHVQWEVAESPVVARLTLATRLQDEGIKQVLSWSADQLPIGGVLEALEVLGIGIVTPAVPTPDTRLRPQDLDERRRYLLTLDTIPVGLTGADAGFAATGTLLLHSGPGRSLLASHLPRRHVVLLAASRIYPNLERWLAGQPRGAVHPALPGAVATLLTGPSRSIDLEATPAYGVHGPGRLHVIVVRGR